MLILKAESEPGDTLFHAIIQASRLADSLHVAVTLTFNGTEAYVHPGDDPHQVAKMWERSRPRQAGS